MPKGAKEKIVLFVLLVIGVLIIYLFVFSSKGESLDTSRVALDTPDHTSTKVSARKVADGFFIGAETLERTVVTSSDDFQKLWHRLYGTVSNAPEQPYVNFDTHSVLALIRGISDPAPKKSSSHDIYITEILDTDTRRWVYTEQLYLGRYCPQSKGYDVKKPFSLYVVPKTTLPYFFEENELIETCQ